MHTFDAHALGIRSAIELPLPPGDPTGPADVVLLRGEDRDVPDAMPCGQPVAALQRADGTLLYGLARDRGRTVLRYPGLCEFVGDADLAHTTAHLHPRADAGILPVLASGALLAVHLRLRGELVLHASAVTANGQAMAFVGASGMGKSTLAAALCTHGCTLVSDDLLRVDPGESPVMVHPGSLENRLRTSARRLTVGAAPGAVRSTADGRLALRPPTRAVGPARLRACLIPRPCRTAADVSVRRLSPAHGLMRLVRFPRMLGWSEPASVAREFQALADLAERVPVFEATVPWELPFRAEVVADLLAATLGTMSAGQR